MSSRAEALRVGDRAVYRLGPTDVLAQIIEVLGAEGYHGAHLVRVRLQLTDSEPVELTVPEVDLRRVQSAA